MKTIKTLMIVFMTIFIVSQSSHAQNWRAQADYLRVIPFDDATNKISITFHANLREKSFFFDTGITTSLFSNALYNEINSDKNPSTFVDYKYSINRILSKNNAIVLTSNKSEIPLVISPSSKSILGLKINYLPISPVNDYNIGICEMPAKESPFNTGNWLLIGEKDHTGFVNELE